MRGAAVKAMGALCQSMDAHYSERLRARLQDPDAAVRIQALPLPPLSVSSVCLSVCLSVFLSLLLSVVAVLVVLVSVSVSCVCVGFSVSLSLSLSRARSLTQATAYRLCAQ